MDPLYIASAVFVSVFGAALLGLLVRRRLPDHHLSAETKDTVKLAMGLVATMAALVLGLLVAAAKGSYDAEKGQVTAMTAKIAFLDRILQFYGPESAPARASLRQTAERSIALLWPADASIAAQTDPAAASGEAGYRLLQALAPQTDEQRAIKSQALSMAVDLGQMRWMLHAQAGTSISTPLLVVVICWLAILFFSFGLFAPSNSTVIIALMVGALSVAGAIFLILELDQPFGGLIRIPSQPMANVVSHLGS